MSRRENQRVEHLVNRPAIARDQHHRVANGSSVVKERGTALQTREQILCQIINHSPAGHRPGPRQHRIERAAQQKQDQPADNRCNQQTGATGIERQRFKESPSEGRQRFPTQHIVHD